jgi:UDP-glucose 4-epimerase
MAETFEGRRVLVTGASGFIGSRLCERLAVHGAEVHAVSRSNRQGKEQSAIHWWQADLAEIDALRQLFESSRPDTVIHLASHVVGGPNVDLVVPTLYSNLVSTVNLLTIATKAGCGRIVLAGTMMAPRPGDSDAPAGSPYAVSKWASIEYARMFQALYGLPIVNLRIFMVYGPGQRDQQKLVPHTILSLLRGENPKLASGEWNVDWVYVDDVVDAFVAAAEAEGIEGRTLDVGSGQLVSVRDVVERLALLIDSEVEPIFGALTDRPGEVPCVADVKQSTARLGWKPKISFDEGLRRTVAWYRERVGIGIWLSLFLGQRQLLEELMLLQ